MSSQLSQRTRSFVRRKLGLPSPLVHGRILDREFLVREGTVPSQLDYDYAWVLACALHAEVFFDVGANVGYDTLLALLSPTIKRVVLIEANPEALSIAAENLIHNQLASRANFVAAFAGDVDNRKVKFWTVGTGAAGSVHKSHAVTAARANSFIEVPGITIDTLCADFNLTPGLIKIDVEGAEYEVLQGGKACAEKRQTRYLVEMHSNPGMTMLANTEKVMSWCRELGYQPWYLAKGERLDSAEQTQHRGRCHLLLQPADWPYPEWLVGIKQSATLETAWTPRNGQSN
jgi:FkbM family methyltransferase